MTDDGTVRRVACSIAAKDADRTIWDARGPLHRREAVIVEIEAVDGLVGYGYSPSWGLNPQTMVGFIILDPDGDNRILTDPGANMMLLTEHVEKFAPTIQQSKVVLTQLEIPVPTVAAALRVGREAGVTTVLNPAPAAPLTSEILDTVDILTPNQSEARILAGLDANDTRPDESVAEKLLDLGVGDVVMTLGAEGALIASRKSIERSPGRAIEVTDTTGAGDGFNAALAVSLADGLVLHEAVRRANHAGALMVATPGVVPALPTRNELNAWLASDPLLGV